MLFLLLAALAQTTPTPPARTIERGQMSFIDAPRQVTARTAAEWSAAWRAHAGDRQPPAVDFSKEMVVGVFLGSRRTSGYAVEIVRTREENGALIVQYVETQPAPRAITAQVITMPYQLVAVPQRAGEVRFEKVDK
ncbi:MAG: protease complex subunit PrcB family protein [Vicinamibacterales bacterium]